MMEFDVESRLARYAYTPYRKQLIEKAADALDEFVSNGIIGMNRVKSIYAVGSLLTKKDRPGDIDVYVSVKGKPKKRFDEKFYIGQGQQESMMYNYPSPNVHKSYKMEGKDVAHIIVTKKFPRSKFPRYVKLYP